MDWKRKPALTQQAWLHELSRRLVWFFPAGQVKEILSDYREQFEAGRDRQKPESEIIQALGTPEEAAAQLLEEEPSARIRCLRQSALWAAALALCWCFLWVCMNTYYFGFFWLGTLLFLPMAASVLFLLLRGPARVELERHLTEEAAVSPILMYCVPFVVTLLFEAVDQIILALSIAGRLPERFDPIYISVVNTIFLMVLEAVLILLLAWLLYRCVTVSIRYFSGMIHTFGAGGALFFSYIFFHRSLRLEFFWSPAIDLMLHLLPYFAGLATALVFRQWLTGRRPLPRFFRGGITSWRDWHHRLGVTLLGWFSAEQTLEILEDYQEQYELGREQGKTEEAILAEMGTPDTVVRELLKEDRKARLRRRKLWVWAIPAGIAVWLLLGLMRTFEFGNIGFAWHFNSYYVPQVGMAVTLLGTASLFVPLHIRARVGLEARFPAPRKPTVWVYLLPLALSALVECLAFCLIDSAGSLWDTLLPNRPLGLYTASLIEFSVLSLLFLLVWILARCSSSGSVRYFPAVPHILGSVTQALCAGIYLSAMDLDYLTHDRARALGDFLPSLYPYLVGVLLTAVSWLALRSAGKVRREG